MDIKSHPCKLVCRFDALTFACVFFDCHSLLHTESSRAREKHCIHLGATFALSSLIFLSVLMLNDGLIGHLLIESDSVSGPVYVLARHAHIHAGYMRLLCP